MKCNADKGGVDIKSNSKPIFAICVSLKFSIHYPSWRRYTFLRTQLRNHRFLLRASEKLVAVTGGVCELIRLYMHLYAL